MVAAAAECRRLAVGHGRINRAATA